MAVPWWVRIARPALAPTAAADVLAGAAFFGGAAAGRLAPAIAASVCIYAAGMVQNDLCDRERDRRLHPDRPLVRRPALAGRALLLAAALYAAGLGLAWWAGTLLPAGIALLLANAYNLALKHVFPLDALTLGSARAANLAIGMHLAAQQPDLRGGLYAAGYLLFIASVTGASRVEDAADPRSRRRGLGAAYAGQCGAFLCCVVLAPGGARAAWILLPWLLQSAIVVAAARTATRAAVKRFVLRSLLLVFVLHAATLLASGIAGALLPLGACAALSVLVLRALPRPPPPAPAAGP